ncbi:hypothetical protein ABEQ74_29700, partial [Paenibacillus solani]
AARTVHRAGVYTLEFEALSGTSVLDVQKKRRSFQNEKMTYEALIKAVLAPYSGADAIVLEGGGKPIGEPIVQYDETDWEFLKRIASHSQTVVISDILEAKPRIHIGVPKLESIELPIDIPYTVSNNTLQYQRANATQQGLQDQDFFQYEIHSGHRYRIGNEAQFRKKQMVVSEVRAAMDKGQFIYTYRLARRNGIRQNRIHNKKLVGISVDGKVLDVKESLVKLHLTMDKEQPKSTAYWFPFTPPTGNVMYCMPQIGTNATLYFPNDAGGKAKVTGCVRTNGGSCGKTGNPNNRYFGTEHGSELEITPTAINITSGSQEPLKISIDDEQGIILTSHRKLTLHAVDDISLYTPKRIIIRTPNMVVAKRLSKLSGFTIESEYHVLGDQVNSDGRDRTSYPKYNDEPATWEGPKVEEPKEEEQEGKKKKKFSWGKLLVAVAVVAVVVAVSVATLGAGTVAGAVAGAALIGAATGAVATVGTMVANDIARGEMSSGWEYLESAATGIIVGAIGGAIFGPFGGSVATSLVPATTGQVVRQLATNAGIGFMSSYTDYSLTELINGRTPNFMDAVTAGMYGSLFAGGFAALAPVAGFLKVGAQKATQHGVDWFKNSNLQDNIRRSMKELANNIPNPFKNIQNRLAFDGPGSTSPYRFDMEDYRRSDGGKGSNGPDRLPDTRSGSGGTSNDGKIPRTGPEWDEYFRSKYGDENVNWKTSSEYKLYGEKYIPYTPKIRPNATITKPSLPKEGKPEGDYAKATGKDARGLVRQNEAADVLAENGYRTMMLDETPNGSFRGNGYGIDPDKSPDFIIERQVFDCYAPDIDTKLNNVLRTLREKTTKQARRIVLNLNDYPVEKRAELIEFIKSQTKKDLKHLDELLIIEDRQVTRAYWRFE